MSDAVPWLLVGLGNPGAKYARNRHNLGFRVVDAFRDRHGTPGGSDWREKFHSEFATVSGEFGRVVVLRPQTYMNRSGKAVVAAANFYRVPPSRIVVVHDELDFVFGRIAIKNGGGHGGHNGLRDIVQLLGSRDFIRVRAGVGRPPKGTDAVAGWLLADFSASDEADLPPIVDRARSAVEAVLDKGVAAAMNEFNQSAGGKKSPKPPSKAESSPAKEGEKAVTTPAPDQAPKGSES